MTYEQWLSIVWLSANAGAGLICGFFIVMSFFDF